MQKPDSTCRQGLPGSHCLECFNLQKKIDSTISVPGFGPMSRANRGRAMKRLNQQQREQHWRHMDAVAGDHMTMMFEQQAPYMMPWLHGRNTEHWFRRPWSHTVPQRLVSTHTQSQTHRVLLRCNTQHGSCLRFARQCYG